MRVRNIELEQPFQSAQLRIDNGDGMLFVYPEQEGVGEAMAICQVCALFSGDYIGYGATCDGVSRGAPAQAEFCGESGLDFLQKNASCLREY